MCICHDDDLYLQYGRELMAAGLLHPSGVRGVYATSGAFEAVIDGIEAVWSRSISPPEAEVLRFPPVSTRANYARIDHIYSFPDLMGSVHSFTGGEAEHAKLLQRFEAGEPWPDDLDATDLMLAPAACYPLYPLATGTLPASGRLVDLKSWVFRHEPSDDPARMQTFRMRELVRLGTPAEALAHRDSHRAAAVGLFKGLGLDVETVVANDPFFGRGGRMMKATQREQTLKYELVSPVANAEKPTAIMSFNCHLDHFGSTFGIRTADGAVAHTSCVAIGLERTALALFKRHGMVTRDWPHAVRQALALS